MRAKDVFNEPSAMSGVFPALGQSEERVWGIPGHGLFVRIIERHVLVCLVTHDPLKNDLIAFLCAGPFALLSSS